MYLLRVLFLNFFNVVLFNLLLFNVKEVPEIILFKTACGLSGSVKEERFEIRRFELLNVFFVKWFIIVGC